jgi:hypothetical protein
LQVPRGPPSVFTNVPNSFHRQNRISASRNVSERNLSLTERNSQPDELALFDQIDKIVSYRGFCENVQERFPDMMVKEFPDFVTIFKITECVPPTIELSVSVYHDFKVKVFYGHQKNYCQ